MALCDDVRRHADPLALLGSLAPVRFASLLLQLLLVQLLPLEALLQLLLLLLRRHLRHSGRQRVHALLDVALDHGQPTGVRFEQHAIVAVQPDGALLVATARPTACSAPPVVVLAGSGQLWLLFWLWLVVWRDSIGFIGGRRRVAGCWRRRSGQDEGDLEQFRNAILAG